MRMLRAVVKETVDFSHQGRIVAYAKDLGEDNIEVIYTSPYGSLGQAGLVAIPEIGAEILIVQPEDDNNWYYTSTIWKTSEGVATESKVTGSRTHNLSQVMPDARIYSDNDYPQKIILQDLVGNKVSLNDRVSSKTMTVGAELRSATGKRITLHDSPEIDAIIIRNEHGDGIMITSDPNVVAAARGVHIKSEGPQRFVCRESSLDLIVKDGREINILNESTGANKPDPSPLHFGNINITTLLQDVNITAQEGRIFIKCKGLFQVNADGKVVIDAIDNIELKTSGDLKLKGGNIILEADNDIDIKAGGSISQQSGGASTVNAGGNFAADGSQIHLNSGIRKGARGVGDIESIPNNYGE